MNIKITVANSLNMNRQIKFYNPSYTLWTTERARAKLTSITFHVHSVYPETTYDNTSVIHNVLT